MRRVPFFLIVLALLATVASCLEAQGLPRPTPTARRSDFTTEGREFWVVFQKNFRDFVSDDKTQASRPADPLQLELFITSSENARGYVEIRGLGFRRDFIVDAGRVINIPIDTAAQVRSSERIEDLAVHIVSDQPVAVYGLDRRFQTTDTYLAHPVNVLGKTYRAMGYTWLQNDLLSQMAVIATENDTRVTITPSVRTQKGRPPGVPFDVKLNRGDVYQVIPKYDPSGNSDLTGTLIESDKPIAVFSGHNCAYVPDPKVKACNLLIEQLPALQSWGRQFFVGTLAGRSSAVIRVLATNDSTHVFENNRLVATLNAGQFYENKNQTQHTMLTADQPVLVAQYSKGFDNGDNVGDPMMIMIAPTEQFLASYRFATPVRGSWHHYINVVVPTHTLDSLFLDDKAVDRKLFQPFGLSRYSIGQIEVSFGTHVIRGPEPFGLYSYGFGYDDASYDAYGNGGGQSMEQVIFSPDTIPPSMDAKLNSGLGFVSAIARDDRLNDLGLDEVRVLDAENLDVNLPKFESGVPQVPLRLTIGDRKQNAYVRFRLRDRAGNSAYVTICAKYSAVGDSFSLQVLDNGRSCDFARDLMIGGFVKYSVIDNRVSIPAGSSPIGNPVELKGAHGMPAWGIGGYAEYLYANNLYLTGRVGFDLWRGDAYGYWPDSLGTTLPDGRRVVEEFKLHRLNVMLTLGAGAQWYFVDRRFYLFGLLNLSVPFVTSETLTRSILSPSSASYPGGNGGTMTMYDGGGPSGLALVVVPELGLGSSLELSNGWRIFGELGAGYSITSISPERDWIISYLFARTGAKIRF